MKTLTAWRTLLAALVAGLALTAGAMEPRGFDDPAMQERYQNLLGELRCLVCQNESLASSDADLAADMRREVHRMMAEGQSDDEIRQYLVDRYGDFVLYRPRITAETYLLWFGPLLLAAIGVVVLLVVIRRRSTAAEPELDPADRERLDQLLDKYRDGS